VATKRAKAKASAYLEAKEVAAKAIETDAIEAGAREGGATGAAGVAN
jgi:hypothetical protein